MSIDIVDYTDKINQLASCTLTYLIQFEGLFDPINLV